MVRQYGLHLISKLRHDAALYFLHGGPQKECRSRKRYGDKIDYHNISTQYQVQSQCDGDMKTRIYLAQMLHRDFAQPLNVVFITKRNVKIGHDAQVNLFSSDLTLSYEKLIVCYSLRFQIEFNSRDAKQFWRLEDFMNIKQKPLTNTLNLSLLMVNVSHLLLQQFRLTNSESGILGLKAYLRAEKYVQETIKFLPEKTRPNFIGTDHCSGCFFRLYSFC